MFDVTFPRGQSKTGASSAGGGPRHSGLTLDATDTWDSCDDSLLMAEPDGDVFGWDEGDEEEEDDGADGNDTDLADGFEDDHDHD